MRTIKEIDKDIEKTRKHLRELYDEHNLALEREVNIDKNKYYTFHSPNDEDIVYTGKVFNYWRNSKGEYQFEVTGIEECFSDIQDSCWAGFDAMHSIVVYNGQLDNFLNGFTEITKEEFDKKVNDVCVNMKKWINYWIES